MRKVKDGKLSDRMARVLFSYRITPQSTTGVSPAELLQGRKLRSRLDLLKPSIATRVEKKQQKQKESHDYHARDRLFKEGEPVYIRKFGKGDTWIPGHIVQPTGPVSFKVLLEEGHIVCRRHLDHLRSRSSSRVTLPPMDMTAADSSIDIPVLISPCPNPLPSFEVIPQPIGEDSEETQQPPVALQEPRPSADSNKTLEQPHLSIPRDLANPQTDTNLDDCHFLRGRECNIWNKYAIFCCCHTVCLGYKLPYCLSLLLYPCLDSALCIGMCTGMWTASLCI